MSFDPGTRAEVTLLTGAAWRDAVIQGLNSAQSSIKISVFLFSPRWHTPTHNILQACLTAAARGLQCRCILSPHPLKVGKRRPNYDTAQKLLSAGWDVRVMDGSHVLHEKLMIFDRSSAIVGSHNLSVSSATTNMDTSLLLQGEAILTQLTAHFWSRWRIASTPDRVSWPLHSPIELPFTP
jgi:phosphatidylserine/phosphatidylglycerophosphate/cardiolipin synthase-like enzyme